MHLRSDGIFAFRAIKSNEIDTEFRTNVYASSAKNALTSRILAVLIKNRILPAMQAAFSFALRLLFCIAKLYLRDADAPVYLLAGDRYPRTRFIPALAMMAMRIGNDDLHLALIERDLYVLFAPTGEILMNRLRGTLTVCNCIYCIAGAE